MMKKHLHSSRGLRFDFVTLLSNEKMPPEEMENSVRAVMHEVLLSLEGLHSLGCPPRVFFHKSVQSLREY